MRGRALREKMKTRKFVTGCAALALAVIIGGTGLWQKAGQEPEFPSYTDPVMEVSIEEEETPLASKPTTKTTKKTKTTRKKVKLKKASKKSYTKKLPTKKKTTNKTQKKEDATIKTQTTVVTATTEKYTKKSRNKVVTQKVTTTVKTTTTANSADGEQVASTAVSAQKGKYEINVAQAAPMMDSRVISAYEKLGFKVYVDSSVNYAGHFDARTRTITLQSEDNTIYHELGHFLAFIAGNVDRTSEFQGIYESEKSLFTGINKAYSTQNSSEYFAESTKEYTLAKASLNRSRPKTSAAIGQALDKLTDAQISKIQTVYGPFWK